MARPRQPADLIQAKGRKHWSQDEYEARKRSELQVPFTNVTPPDSLTSKKQKAEFNEIAEKLVALNIFTELDVDALARYIISKDLYLIYTKKLKAMLKDDEVDMREVSTVQQLQDKAYRQTVTSANELCLNIASRAKLVIPQPPNEDDDEL